MQHDREYGEPDEERENMGDNQYRRPAIVAQSSTCGFIVGQELSPVIVVVLNELLGSLPLYRFFHKEKIAQIQ